jgi:hypothetical protein
VDQQVDGAKIAKSLHDKRYNSSVNNKRGAKLKRMTPDDVFARIINHELLHEEVKYVKNLSKGIVSTKKDDIALKASKKTKKEVLVESSSEVEQDEDDEEEDEEKYPT